MADQNQQGSNFTAIIQGLFTRLRDEAPFLAGLVGVQWAIRFALQLLGRYGAHVPIFTGSLSLLALAVGMLNAAVVALGGAVLYRRLFRREAGTPGSFRDDLAIDGNLALTILGIALIFFTPTIVQSLASMVLPTTSPGGTVLGSFVTMLLGIAALVMVLNWCFAPAAAVERRRGALDALNASRRIISGHRWLVFGCFLLVGLIAGIPSIALTLSHMRLGATGQAPTMLGGFSRIELAFVTAMSQLETVVSVVLLFAMYSVFERTRRGMAGDASLTVFD